MYDTGSFCAWVREGEKTRVRDVQTLLKEHAEEVEGEGIVQSHRILEVMDGTTGLIRDLLQVYLDEFAERHWEFLDPRGYDQMHNVATKVKRVDRVPKPIREWCAENPPPPRPEWTPPDYGITAAQYFLMRELQTPEGMLKQMRDAPKNTDPTRFSIPVGGTTHPVVIFEDLMDKNDSTN